MNHVNCNTCIFKIYTYAYYKHNSSSYLYTHFLNMILDMIRRYVQSQVLVISSKTIKESCPILGAFVRSKVG